MITQIWALSKKTFILFFIISMVVFAKVEKIYDEFDGTYYYQTEHFYIANGMKMPYPEYRFRTTKTKDNHRIVMELNVISLGLVAVDDNNKVRIRCENGNIVVLDYETTFSYKGKSFGFMGSGNEAIKCIAILTEADIEALLSGINMIRIEIKNEFTNFVCSSRSSSFDTPYFCALIFLESNVHKNAFNLGNLLTLFFINSIKSHNFLYNSLCSFCSLLYLSISTSNSNGFEICNL